MQLSTLEEASIEPSVHPSVNSSTKRFIDIVGASIGLVITGVAFIPIAIAIRFDSPGSALYSQVRCGLKGNYFRIWKFRSMLSEAEALKQQVKNEASGHIFKSKNDPRITRIGKVLRKTSLDELPQFWNVIKGEMSLVGTRPPTPDEVKHYSSHHLKRLRVKPGMTGEWQVRGRSSVQDFDEIVQMDLHYQRKWSVFYDLSLIARTVWVVLTRQGAY